MLACPRKIGDFRARNKPFTHITDAASFLKMRDSTIRAEELSYISSYQMSKKTNNFLEVGAYAIGGYTVKVKLIIFRSTPFLVY